jgi:gamma-glutamyl-gamma-aminobutyrate hydrolase PuuD
MKRVLAICGSPAHWKPDNSLPYEEALRSAGIEPVLIDPQTTTRTIPVGISGLVLMGGSDVNPARYGESRRPETEDPDNARDDLECALIQEALDRDLPLLAICRGIQILNVQHGGTLVQHLDTTALHRRKTEDRGQPVHQVDIVPGTRLAAIEEDLPRLDVNSRHHQAIGKLGNALQISARAAEDGTIEAVERPGKRFVLGVQWHPENQAATDPRQAKLFEAFAAAL